jgi:ribosomal protein S12 methylthiotransferase
LVFLNTCGFISSGREEMFQTLEKLLYHKKKVCLIGCAVQYFSSPLLKGGSKETKRQSILSNPNLSLLSRNDLKTVALPQIFQGFKSQIFPNFERFDSPRALTNFDQGFEYLKIAEGCNNSCSFCIIPHIRGKQISLPLPHLLHEIHHLVQQGIHEIILIAQDSTRYGTDLYGKPQLFELLEQIEKIP